MARSEDDSINDKPMPLLEHLVELRQRLMWSIVAFVVSFLVCYYFSNRIYFFLAEPLATVLREQGKPDPHLIYTQLYEAFFTRIKVAFFGGAFIGFPVIASQIWHVRRARPVSQREARAAAVPARHAGPVLPRRRTGLLFRVPVRLAVLRQLPDRRPAAAACRSSCCRGCPNTSTW